MIRRGLSTLLFFLLGTAPLALLAVNMVFPDIPVRVAHFIPENERIASYLVPKIIEIHFLLSRVSAFIIPKLLYRWGARIFAWVGIVIWAFLIFHIGLFTTMTKTGFYL